MNIYWCGGEDIDFPNGTTVYTRTDAAAFRSGYARAALSSSAQGVAPSNNVIVGSTFPVGAITSGWLQFRMTSTNTENTNIKMCGFTKSGKASGEGLYVGLGNPATKIRLITWNGSNQTQLAVESGTSISAGGDIYLITMEVIDYGASATVRVYVNSNMVIEYTGDVRISSITDIDRVGISGEGNKYRHVMSEIIVADSDTRTLSLVTLFPNAAGDTNDWTGAYTDIDEGTISDADAVYVDSAAQDAQFNLSGTPAGTFSVDAIKVVARNCKTGDAAVGTLHLGVKSNGTVDVDDGHASATAWGTSEWLTPTVNEAQLTTALLDALQLNLRSAA